MSFIIIVLKCYVEKIQSKWTLASALNKQYASSVHEESVDASFWFDCNYKGERNAILNVFVTLKYWWCKLGVLHRKCIIQLFLDSKYHRIVVNKTSIRHFRVGSMSNRHRSEMWLRLSFAWHSTTLSWVWSTTREYCHFDESFDIICTTSSHFGYF